MVDGFFKISTWKPATWTTTSHNVTYACGSQRRNHCSIVFNIKCFVFSFSSKTCRTRKNLVKCTGKQQFTCNSLLCNSLLCNTVDASFSHQFSTNISWMLSCASNLFPRGFLKAKAQTLLQIYEAIVKSKKTEWHLLNFTYVWNCEAFTQVYQTDILQRRLVERNWKI